MGASLASLFVSLSCIAPLLYADPRHRIEYDLNVGSFGNLYIERAITFNPPQKENIVLTQDLSLEEAFFGKEISVDVERNVVIDGCLYSVCEFCGGTKFVKSDIRYSWHQAGGHISAPCHVCYGTGFVRVGDCALYQAIKTTVTLTIPPGCKPGFKSVYKYFGNEVLKYDNSKSVGDLEIVISSVESRNFKVMGDHVELLVEMTASEALDGFLYTVRSYVVSWYITVVIDCYILQVPYVDGKSLQIDHRNKITLPGSNSTVAGLGLPVLELGPTGEMGGAATSTDDTPSMPAQDTDLGRAQEGTGSDGDGAQEEVSEDSPKTDSDIPTEETNEFSKLSSKHRENLVILFELKALSTENDYMFDDAYIEETVTSQEEFDDLVAKFEERQQEIKLRSLLLFLQRQKEEDEKAR